MAEGLRERKVRLTRRRIEKAAVDFAYEGGIKSVTVEQICDAAMVSRSTFFNYFPSLDQAIFGPPLEYDPALTERLLTTHSDDLVVAASLIVTESVRGESDDAVTRRRLALCAREPGTTPELSRAPPESAAGVGCVIRLATHSH